MNLRILIIIALGIGVYSLYRSDSSSTAAPPGNEASIVNASGSPVTIAIPPGGLPPEQWQRAMEGRWRDDQGATIQLLPVGTFSGSTRDTIQQNVGGDSGSALVSLTYTATVRGNWTLQGQQLQLSVKEVPQLSIDKLDVDRSKLPPNVSQSSIDSAVNKFRTDVPKTFSGRLVGQTSAFTINSVTPQEIKAIDPSGKPSTLRRQP